MFQIFADKNPLYTPGNPYKTVTTPTVVRELGKAGSLTCGLPPGNDLYNDLTRLRSTIEVKSDSRSIFRGRLLSEEKSFQKIRTLYCEGDLAYLVDSVQRTDAYTGTTHELFKKIISKHNSLVEAEKQFKIGRITIEDREIIITGQTDDEGDTGEIDYKQIAINSMANEWSTSFDQIQNCLIDYCGGYLLTREESDGIYIDYLADGGDVISQEIEFGVNLLDMTEEITAEELFTVLIPLGDENLTISSVNNGSDELVDEEMVAKYGRIIRTHVFENVNQASTLLENGQRYLKSQINIPRTFTISAIDLHLLNPDMSPINVGDKVRVKSPPHGISDTMLCTKIEYDLENAENTLYTFGNPKQTLTERYRKDKRKTQSAITSGVGSGGGGAGKSAAKDAVKEATEYVYKEWIDYDPDNPDGHISLGGLVEQYQNSIKVLEQQVGIDMNATEGNVNIRTLRSEYDEFEKKTQEQFAGIDLKVDDAFTQIESTTTYIKNVEGKVTENHTTITQRADELEASITSAVKYTSEVEDQLVENTASLELRADELGSSITANADEININANKIATINTELLEINAEITSVKKLVADEIDALRSEIDISISEVVTTKTLNVSSNLNVQSNAFNFGGSKVSKTTIPVVTSFTQAFGETAQTTDYTFLTTSVGNAVARQPLAGQTITF